MWPTGISVDCYSASKDMIERGFHEPKWQITVKPVPRGQRHLIQVQLLQTGLPFVREWPTGSTIDGRTGNSGVSFFYDEETKTLGFEVVTNLEPETG